MEKDKASTPNKGKDIHVGSASDIEMAIEARASNIVEKLDNEMRSMCFQQNSSEKHISECCIYRVPKPLRNVNWKVYAPVRISIGPLHRGNKRLEAMEKEKRKYFKKLTERDWMDKKKKCDIVISIKNQEERLRYCYSEKFKKIESDDFVEMILLDAVFIIQFFLESNGDKNFEPRMTFDIREDLMLLENQIPLFIIQDIYDRVYPRSQPFLDLATCYFGKYSFLKKVETSPGVKGSRHFTGLLRILMWCKTILGVEIETSLGVEKETSPGGEIETSAGVEKETSAGVEKETSPGGEIETSAGTVEIETSPGGEIETSAGTVEIETSAGVEIETILGVEIETSSGGEKETNPGGEIETSAGVEIETILGVEKETSAGGEIETSAGVEKETSLGVKKETSPGVEKETILDVENETSLDVENETSPGVEGSRHFTDLLRNLMLSRAIPRSYSFDPVKLKYTAVMLHKAGVRFQATRDKCLVNITFDKGVLKIPQVEVDHNFERLVRNIMAMEQCLYKREAYICSYIKFMDHLIDSAEDVGLLVENGIIVRRLGDDAAVSKMINHLCDNIDTHTCFGDISQKLNDHYDSTFRRAIATLVLGYFPNIWIAWMEKHSTISFVRWQAWYLDISPIFGEVQQLLQMLSFSSSL